MLVGGPAADYVGGTAARMALLLPTGERLEEAFIVSMVPAPYEAGQ